MPIVETREERFAPSGRFSDPMPLSFADPIRMQNRIRDILNASPSWAALVSDPGGDKKRSEDAIQAARIESGFEVLRAISRNTQGGYYGALVSVEAIDISAYDDANGVFLAYDGEPGIPQISPFPGAPFRDGIPANPDEIDSYRNDSTEFPMYTAGLDGLAIPHNQPDANGFPSPVAGLYSIQAGLLKFTGDQVRIPLIILTEEMAAAKIPAALEPAVIKLSPAKVIKPGDALYQVAGLYARLGSQDLIEIEGGALKVLPVPNITQATKQL